MTTKNLLVELFVEELPPKALKRLGEAFAATLSDSLRTQGLATADSALTAYASPRRLAVHLTGVLAQAADKPVAQKLMPASVGLDAQGQATPALIKKLSSLGTELSVVPQLRRAMDGKAEVLFYDSVAKGALLADGLQVAIIAALSNLPIPKVMTYQLADGWETVDFVRPAHGLVALHGDQVVPLSVLGLQSGRLTHGHRFEALVDPIVLINADSYAQQLEAEGAVIASFAARRAEIASQLQAAAAKAGAAAHAILQPIEDPALLDEVTALVERPNVLIGHFEEDFLEVPQECLILTMKANQKYFPLLDTAGTLTSQFLIVSNIRPTDPSAVITGNERVIRPRLADAKFFFDQDRKKTLALRIPGLAKVVYHGKLGTQGERILRVRAIARAIGQQLGGKALAQQADSAAQLAKADLLTDMVGEFPELQGIMGRYYALHDGYTAEIADAIEDHYKPRFAGDSLPRNQIGLVVALADKLETLVGLFGIGQVPTGDRDPFALRRHALGVIRMLIERELPLSLETTLITAFGFIANADSLGLSEPKPEAGAKPASSITAKLDPAAPIQVANFIYERLAGLLREQGYTAQEIDAVLSLRPQRLADVPKRLAAVRLFAALPEAESLAAANKRVSNILKKAGGDVLARVDSALLQEDAETQLSEALTRVNLQAEAAFARGDYAASLQALAALKLPVDTFFDAVMVNAEDAALRANRLGLLASLHQAMNRIADLSRLAG